MPHFFRPREIFNCFKSRCSRKRGCKLRPLRFNEFLSLKSPQHGGLTFVVNQSTLDRFDIEVERAMTSPSPPPCPHPLARWEKWKEEFKASQKKVNESRDKKYRSVFLLHSRRKTTSTALPLFLHFDRTRRFNNYWSRPTDSPNFSHETCFTLSFLDMKKALSSLSFEVESKK